MKQERMPGISEKDTVDLRQDWTIPANQNPTGILNSAISLPSTLVDNIVAPVVQTQPGAATPTPSLPHGNSAGATDAHGCIQVAHSDSGPRLHSISGKT